MKPGAGKQKGNSFEGLIAKKLTKALVPLTFIRSPGSGARVGGKNFETMGKMFGSDALKLFVADVVPTNERDAGLNFNFSIECKSYKTQDNFVSLASGSANLYKWFKESQDDAVKIGKKPLLVFKWNHSPTFVAGLQSDLICPCNACFSISKNGQTLIVFEFEELLNHPHFWYTKNEM